MPYKIRLRDPNLTMTVKEWTHRQRKTWRRGGVMTLQTEAGRYFATKSENILTIEETK